MGLLDALKKLAGEAVDMAGNVAEAAAGIVDDVTDEANDLFSKAEQKVTETVAAHSSADTPSAAKPSVERETSFFGGEEGDDEFQVRFLLSGDFVEFDSNCDWCPSYQYEPTCTDDYTEYKTGSPCIAFGPNREAYRAAESFLENGRPVGREFTAINNGTFLFRSKFNDGKDILLAYVFAPGTAMAKDVLGLIYSPSVEGTPLEKKLIAALEEVAATYTETPASNA